MEVNKSKRGTIAIDFDGVINSYASGFVAVDKIPDDPVPGVFGGIINYIDYGFEVCIYSTRNESEKGRKAIQEYLIKYHMPQEYIDKIRIVSGKPVAKLYIDDRGYQFAGKLPEPEYIEGFKPWHGGKSSSQT